MPLIHHRSLGQALARGLGQVPFARRQRYDAMLWDGGFASFTSLICMRAARAARKGSAPRAKRRFATA